MKSYGLKTSELNEIKNLLEEYFGDLRDVKVYLFGSRAKGNYKPFSDIDIAVKSKSPELSKKIALFQEAWEKSKLPYRVDITAWKDLFKPYLQEIRKTKASFWEPQDKKNHEWRACPYGQHWVVKHPRFPIGRQVQDVDGHCRKNPSGKDLLRGDEIDFISMVTSFQNTRPLPTPFSGKTRIEKADDYDVLIAGWCKYWNDIFRPDIPIDVNFIKALIESESRFNPDAQAPNKKSIGPARGLIQLTEQTWRILKDRKGEIKDHYIDLKKDELFNPSKNICAAVRWLFRKRQILEKRLGRSPQWPEVIVEYKGLGPGLKKNNPKSILIMKQFNEFYKKYRQ